MPVHTRSQSVATQAQKRQPTRNAIKGSRTRAAKSSHATRCEGASMRDDNRENFPFLSLPPEIRLMVMRYHFGSQTFHIISTLERDGLDHRFCEAIEGGILPTGTWVDLALLSVNKQLHLEATEVFYSAQTFVFHCTYDLECFCNEISPSTKRALRKIELTSLPMGPELCAKVRGMPEMLGPIHEFPWPQNSLPAFEEITDLKLDVDIRHTPGVDHPQHWPTSSYMLEKYGNKNHVANGPIHGFHETLRWQYGFLRKLEKLRNVKVEMHDRFDQLDAAYLPIISAQFEAALLSNSVDDIIRAEAEEQDWINRLIHLKQAMSKNAFERTFSLEQIDRAKDRLPDLEHKTERQLAKIEKARTAQHLGYLKEILSKDQKALEIASQFVEKCRGDLAKAEAFDRAPVEREVEELKGKIAAYDARVYAYIGDFERSRTAQ